MDRIDAIRLFVRLVECGSFSAAGREEAIGQPAVSKQIAKLESHLGAQLVLRTSRSVVITEAGQKFYESAKQLVNDFDALESSVGHRQVSPRGLVRISTAPAHGRLCITPLLSAFFQQYPDVTIDISVSERHVDLIGDGVDVAIRHGRLSDSALIARKLSETALVLAADRTYLARSGVPTCIRDLDSHKLVVFAKEREQTPWIFRVENDPISYTPRGNLVTGDAEHIRAAVLSGLGIAQAPAWLFADEVKSGHVHILLPQMTPETVPIHLIHAAGRRVPMRVRVFMEYLISAYDGAE